MAYAAKIAGRPYNKNPYDWNLTTVYRMIENKVYLGHTVNCKKRKVSFKSKKITIQPEEKWIVVENTHEPIVSEQLFKDANSQISSRKRECKNKEPHLFAGLVKCDTCGYSLSIIAFAISSQTTILSHLTTIIHQKISDRTKIRFSHFVRIG